MRGLALHLVIATVLTLGVLGAPAFAQLPSNCVFCHSQSAGSLPPIHRTAEWQASGHAAPSIGCETCHAGDASSTRPTDAHRGVLPSTSARSTVNEVNLPSTCVACHRTTVSAVSGTIHQILAEAGDMRTPTCVTCHGSNISEMPTPAEAERQCASCHKPGSPRASYPAAARPVLDAIASLRASEATISAEIATTSNSARRAELISRLFETQTTLRTASAAFHEFRPAAMTQTLASMRHRLADLSETNASARR